VTRPIRLQLSRKPGFNLQELSRAANGLPAVNVARPSKWGNPRRVGMYRSYGPEDAVHDYRRWLDREPGYRSWENIYGKPPTFECIRAELAGKNLACWCRPGAPCHADALLEIANTPETLPASRSPASPTREAQEGRDGSLPARPDPPSTAVESKAS
jgi:hypothetical protein